MASHPGREGASAWACRGRHCPDPWNSEHAATQNVGPSEQDRCAAAGGRHARSCTCQDLPGSNEEAMCYTVACNLYRCTKGEVHFKSGSWPFACMLHVQYHSSRSRSFRLMHGPWRCHWHSPGTRSCCSPKSAGQARHRQHQHLSPGSPGSRQIPRSQSMDASYLQTFRSSRGGWCYD